MIRPLVRPYDEAWVGWFRQLERRLEPCLDAGAQHVEHVGSTSIRGMAAKPIIDLDIVIAPGTFESVRVVLEQLGYEHRGDQDVEGREVFKIVDPAIDAALPPHHLYVCEEGSAPLASHRLFREFLASRPDRVSELSTQKLDAAARADHDREVYMDLKAPAYAGIIAEAILVRDA
jgi:GrpB-like predicted nucleotidyltransferase (UPF0157 family)